jgi:hypothetical protein
MMAKTDYVQPTTPSAGAGPKDTSAGATAKKLTPQGTQPVKRPAVSTLRLGGTVYARLGEGRALLDPNGVPYEPAPQLYYLLVTVTLLRQIKAGDWVLADQAQPS